MFDRTCDTVGRALNDCGDQVLAATGMRLQQLVGRPQRALNDRLATSQRPERARFGHRGISDILKYLGELKNHTDPNSFRKT